MAKRAEKPAVPTEHIPPKDERRELESAGDSAFVVGGIYYANLDDADRQRKLKAEREQREAERRGRALSRETVAERIGHMNGDVAAICEVNRVLAGECETLGAAAIQQLRCMVERHRAGRDYLEPDHAIRYLEAVLRSHERMAGR